MLAVLVYMGSALKVQLLDQSTEMLQYAAEIARTAAPDDSSLKELAGRLPSETSRTLRVTFFSARGELLTGSPDPDGVPPEVIEAMSGTVGVSKRTDAGDRSGRLYVAWPPEESAKETGAGGLIIRVSVPAAPLIAAHRNIHLNVALAMLMLTAAVILMFSWVGRRVRNVFAAIANIADRSEADRPTASGISLPTLGGSEPVIESIDGMAGRFRRRLESVERRCDELQAVPASMVEGVIVLSDDMTILDMNPAAYRLLNHGDGDGIGEKLLYYFRNTELLGFAERTLESPVPIEEIITFIRAREIYLRVHGSVIRRGADAMQDLRPPVRHGRGERTVVLVVSDITELKTLERIRRDFVANVSHELKTPITTIRGYIETLLSGDYRDPESSLRFLRIAENHIERLQAIIEDLLSLSRLERRGSPGLELEGIQLRPAVDGAVKSREGMAAERNITVRFEYTEDLEARANPSLVEQAVANLVDNAIKYSEEGSEVLVRMDRDGTFCRIAVEDTGSGIPEKEIPRIFERFYRVDRARSRELGGTGLGLSIVKHIAAAHDGSIDVSSEEGRGSTFTLRIPLTGSTLSFPA